MIKTIIIQLLLIISFINCGNDNKSKDDSSKQNIEEQQNKQKPKIEKDENISNIERLKQKEEKRKKALKERYEKEQKQIQKQKDLSNKEKERKLNELKERKEKEELDNILKSIEQENINLNDQIRKKELEQNENEISKFKLEEDKLQKQKIKEENKYKGPTDDDYQKARNETNDNLKKINEIKDLDYLIDNMSLKDTDIFTKTIIDEKQDTETKLINLIGDNKNPKYFDKYKQFFNHDNQIFQEDNLLDFKIMPLCLMSQILPIALCEVQSLVAKLQNIGKDLDIFKDTYRHKDDKPIDKDGNKKNDKNSIKFYLQQLDTDIKGLEQFLGNNGTWQDVTKSNFKDIFNYLKTKIFDTKGSLGEIVFILRQVYDQDEKNQSNKLKADILSLELSKQKEAIQKLESPKYDNLKKELSEFIKDREAKFDKIFNKEKGFLEKISKEKDDLIFKYIEEVKNLYKELNDKIIEGNKLFISQKLQKQAKLSKDLFVNINRDVTWTIFIGNTLYGALKKDFEQEFIKRSKKYKNYRTIIIKKLKNKDPDGLNNLIENIKPYYKYFERDKSNFDKDKINRSNKSIKTRINDDNLIATQFLEFGKNINKDLEYEKKLIKDNKGINFLNKMRDIRYKNRTIIKYLNENAQNIRETRFKNIEERDNQEILLLEKNNALNIINTKINNLEYYISELEKKKTGVIPLGYRIEKEKQEFDKQLKILLQ